MGTLKYLERLSGKDISKKEQCRQRTRELFTLKRFLIIDKSVIPSPAIKCTFSVLRAQLNVAYWQIRGLNLNKDDYLLLPKDQRQTTCFLLALASCLTWLLERSPPGIDICILVEKRTYLHCIEIYVSRDKYAQEIWKLMYRVRRASSSLKSYHPNYSNKKSLVCRLIYRYLLLATKAHSGSVSKTPFHWTRHDRNDP